MKSLIFYIGK